MLLMFIQKNDVRNLAKSFSYAFKGITYCIKNERNMRIHICMTILVA
ncbi:MAG: diacylglycerol kinase, partial [Oscillospiraceae bacterium]